MQIEILNIFCEMFCNKNAPIKHRTHSEVSICSDDDLLQQLFLSLVLPRVAAFAEQISLYRSVLRYEII
jgi:hypothetical protein